MNFSDRNMKGLSSSMDNLCASESITGLLTIERRETENMYCSVTVMYEVWISDLWFGS